MKIFITGGTGLTGREITRRLALAGHQVIALYRNRKFDQPGVEWLRGDLNDFSEEMPDLLSNTDIVIHHAASLNTGNLPSDIEELERMNVKATEILLRQASAARVKKFIFTSSLSLLKKPLPELITEASEMDPVLPYSVSKYTGERMVKEYAGRSGFGFNILRLSSPVGTPLSLMRPNVLKKWIEDSMRGENLVVYGDGGRTQDFISVKDIATAFVQCVEKTEVSGVFNIASGTPLSMYRLASLITSGFGNSFACSGEDPNSSDRWNISIQKANTLLNFHPVYTSEEAISELINSTLP